MMLAIGAGAAVVVIAFAVTLAIRETAEQTAERLSVRPLTPGEVRQNTEAMKALRDAVSALRVRVDTLEETVAADLAAFAQALKPAAPAPAPEGMRWRGDSDELSVAFEGKGYVGMTVDGHTMQVIEVARYGPAACAGVRPGDTIVCPNSIERLRSTVNRTYPGDTLRFDVRGAGRSIREPRYVTLGPAL